MLFLSVSPVHSSAFVHYILRLDALFLEIILEEPVLKCFFEFGPAHAYVQCMHRYVWSTQVQKNRENNSANHTYIHTRALPSSTHFLAAERKDENSTNNKKGKRPNYLLEDTFYISIRI